MSETYDAVVVGSGYGGSVAACRMAKAGIKVCLIEKGRRWEAHEFPRDSRSLVSATRTEWRRWGFGFGSKQALFQIYDEGDSLAAVACGLGGGSLVNAGVMVPTPVRARRDPRWPKDWRMGWEVYEQQASEMLDAQSVPVEFPNARIMQQIVDEDIEDCRPDPIKLSINFGQGSQEGTSSCLACGNCLSGCPYNAKNSTDKNYLASAIQDGCVVKTQRKVLYVLENPELTFGELHGTKQQKKWRVYLDDLEYISADFVVLSAGVLGTAEILLQSRKRGLNLSKRLGLGLSCNGNNVAYVAQSQAPINSQGLDREQILSIPFKKRPGPAISSSYTSSLGFTIQSGVLPTSYPYLLFKGIATYGTQSGSWFIHGLIDKLKRSMGSSTGQDMVLNAMGHDASDGTITLDEETEMVCVTPPNDPILPQKIQAFRKLSDRLGGILFMSRYRSTSVHLLGGCSAASDPSSGVCNPRGQVFDSKNVDQATTHEGLYVCDASLIPCSVGINPSLTISTIAEHVSRYLVQDIMAFKSRSCGSRTVGEDVSEQDLQYVDKIINSQSHLITKERVGVDERIADENPISRPQDTVTIRETMKGLVGGMHCTANLVIKMNIGSECDRSGTESVKGASHHPLKGRVGGHVVFPAIGKDKLFIVDGRVDMCSVDSRTPYTQYLHYSLILAAASGSRYTLEGRKIMNPYLLGLYVLSESTTMNVTFKELTPYDHRVLKGRNDMNDKPTTDLLGELHISSIELLKSFVRLEGKHRGKFVSLLLKSLWRTYISQIPRQMVEEDHNLVDITRNPYPVYMLHELETDDGHKISCQNWRSCAKNREEEMRRYPVLLLNGHSAESYYLPSEGNDLVRTLLGEGHEVWLLRTRVHPLNPSNDFTIEDIGKFDIPAVMKRILEVNGTQTKIHVIAHCVGGLAIHIAILGGHISALQIASLACTNSSMFFKLTTSALVKMWLPLIPITMALLGKDRILSMYATTKENYRHRIVKFIAQAIPRTECCTCKVCETFSGIFGSPFWHENVSRTAHQWVNKHSLPKLPLSAFPHLRRICTSGFIVDSRGRNKYLIHPERMSLPTLYISGGRSLLVTPETTLLAHRYMRLHQPGYRHRRVVVDGFGHSDLLIGEESPEKVFPHFVTHMRMAERGEGKEERECKGDVVSWESPRRPGGLQFFSMLTNLLCVLAALLILYYFCR